jgi:hypothetical protein
MTIDLSTPQAQAAEHFMRHKGLGNLRPHDVEQLEDQPCWYFYYELPEGELELEVAYEVGEGWECMVTTFKRNAS